MTEVVRLSIGCELSVAEVYVNPLAPPGDSVPR